jgi:hypothetical protein
MNQLVSTTDETGVRGTAAPIDEALFEMRCAGVPPAYDDKTDTNLDRLDRVIRLSSQLDALLIRTTGAEGSSFRAWADDIQENYMWACADIATELRRLIENLEVSHV